MITVLPPVSLAIRSDSAAGSIGAASSPVDLGAAGVADLSARQNMTRSAKLFSLCATSPNSSSTT